MKLRKLGTKLTVIRFAGRQRIPVVVTSIAYFENNHKNLGTSFACFFWLAHASLSNSVISIKRNVFEPIQI